MGNVTTGSSNYSTEQVTIQDTFPAGVAIRRGQCITPDGTTGKWRLALATSSANAGNIRYFATKTVKANEALTGNLVGIGSYGEDLAAVAPGAKLYLSDTPGELSDTPGTKNIPLGVVLGDFREVTPKRIFRFWPQDEFIADT